jgi:hypothetical protein
MNNNSGVSQSANQHINTSAHQHISKSFLIFAGNNIFLKQ